jgi:(R,R)-butanediol dehydrogenase/meso-butanediol dehydrogenase/diacetyl reductase
MVIGTGGIGSFIVAAAKAMGVPVLACDLDPERLAIASRLGATETVLTDGVSPLDLDVHAEVIFEASGTPSGLSTAIQALSPGGRLVLVGIQGRPADVDLPRITIAEYELIGTNALDTPSDTSAALTLLQRQRENLEHLAPRVFPLTDAPAVFQESGAAVKTLLSPAIETPRPSVMN